MKIGILGSGNVGRELALGFARNGHHVTIGTGHPTKAELTELVQNGRGAIAVGSFSEAAGAGEVVAICCLGSAVDEVLTAAGTEALAGKVVIDVTNPLDFTSGMPPGLFVGTTDSLGERIQRRLPMARVVKCFNIVGHPTMVHPQMADGAPTMMLAGNDGPAKQTVAGLAKEFGWEEPLDIGGIDGARWLEALVPLWVRVAARLNMWTPAFKVLSK